MKTKREIQITVDILMPCILLLQMSYSIAGELIHEILGVSLFVLFVLHHVFSAGFSKGLIKGKKTPEKILKTVLDILLTVDILALIFSAVLVSKHVFVFLGIDTLSSLGRTIHLLASYWGFALMGIHLGFHFDFILNKHVKTEKSRKITFSAIAVLSAAGLFFFIKEGIIKYMLLINRFVFFETTGGLPLFVFKYLLILIMFVFAGYGIIKTTGRRKV